jgi:sigma-E factor negative regulatory protein RseC
MDSPHGRIIELIPDAEPRRAVIEVISAMQCPRCAAGKGCGAGLLGGDERPRRVDALVPGDLDVRDGDMVWLDLSSQHLLNAALAAYGAPLAGILAMASGAYVAALSDLQSILITLLGGCVGAAAGRIYLRQRRCLRRMTPRVGGRYKAERA